MSEKPKKFLIFSGCDFYPNGGIKDYFGSEESLNAAMERIMKINDDMDCWAQIVERDSLKLICDCKGHYEIKSDETFWIFNEVIDENE